MSLSVKLAGLGSYLPERLVPNEALGLHFGVEPDLIERVTGIAVRRYATRETQTEMGAAAARMALERAGRTIDEIDLIVSASAAPQQAIPCTAALLQRELGAPVGRSTCFDINATCLSFMVALWNVAHLIEAGAYRRALIISADKPSCSLDPNAWEATVLFGDAAAAAVVEASPGDAKILGARFDTWSDGAELIRIRGGGTLYHPNSPDTHPEMNWFAMQGPLAFRFVLREVRLFVDSFMDQIGWRHDEVDQVIPHQASRHGVEQVESRLGFAPHQVFSNLHTRGNCVAASVPLALAEAEQAGRIQRGNKLLLLGTGAGITLGALALRF